MVLEKQALRWSQEVIGTSWHSGMWKNRQNTVYDIETTILVGTLMWPNFLSVPCDLKVQFVLTLLSVITDSLSQCLQTGRNPVINYIRTVGGRKNPDYTKT